MHSPVPRSAPGAKMSYDYDPDVPHAEDYSSWFLWPGFSFQVYPGNVLNTYRWRPVDTGHVTVWRGWYTEGGSESAVIRQLAVQDRETTVEEDIHLVESVHATDAGVELPVCCVGRDAELIKASSQQCLLHLGGQQNRVGVE